MREKYQALFDYGFELGIDARETGLVSKGGEGLRLSAQTFAVLKSFKRLEHELRKYLRTSVKG